MDEERRLLIAVVEAHARACAAYRERPNTREAFLAAAALEWELAQAAKYVESIHSKRATPMPASTAH